MRRVLGMFGGIGGLIGGCLVLLIVVDGLAAPWIAPYDPLAVDMLSVL